MKKLLLMSSSRQGNQGYLEHAGEQLEAILKGEHGKKRITRVLFVPYADASANFGEYENKVRPVFAALGATIQSIHHFTDVLSALEEAEAICVGGGNTFALLARLQEKKLLEAVRRRVEQGLHYIGWSAGANVACPTIRTTNDMPIVQTASLNAFKLVPFQINPHFISGKPAGHNGESREERLVEFLEMNPTESVLALPEGSALYVRGEEGAVLGGQDALIFRQGGRTETLRAGQNFPLCLINGDYRE